jgi:molecular chaperone Hsp33
MHEKPDRYSDIPIRFVTEASSDDVVVPFQVEALDIRGRCVHLGASLDALLERHAYPPAVSRALGEAVVLTSLLGTALKFEGRFQLQTRTDGPINMILVDFDAPNRLRGYASFDAAKVQETVAKPDPNLSLNAQLLGRGHLGLTLEQGSAASRYQGIVALEGQGLEQAALQYFKQSEQIPTFLRLAVGEVMNADEGKSHVWRGGGLLVQFLPSSSERQRQSELDAGDAPKGYTPTIFKQDEAWQEDKSWTEACALAETVEDHELLDPAVSSERLLYRLFNEHDIKVFNGLPMSEACRCFDERIKDMLARFSQQDRNDMIADDGKISVTCEFCSKRYVLNPTELENRT